MATNGNWWDNIGQAFSDLNPMSWWDPKRWQKGWQDQASVDAGINPSGKQGEGETFQQVGQRVAEQALQGLPEKLAAIKPAPTAPAGTPTVADTVAKIQPNGSTAYTERGQANEAEAKRLFDARSHAVEKLTFNPATNYWSPYNAQQIASVNQQTGDVSKAVSNQMDRAAKSFAARGIDPRSGITAETERLARFEGAKNLGGALNQIEANRFQNFANHETTQTGLRNEFDMRKAAAVDALTRGDVEGYQRMMDAAQRFNAGDMQNTQSRLDLASNINNAVSEDANRQQGNRMTGQQLTASEKAFNDPYAVMQRADAPKAAYEAQQFDQKMRPVQSIANIALPLIGAAGQAVGLFRGMPTPSVPPITSGSSSTSSPMGGTLAGITPGGTDGAAAAGAASGDYSGVIPPARFPNLAGHRSTNGLDGQLIGTPKGMRSNIYDTRTGYGTYGSGIGR